MIALAALLCAHGAWAAACTTANESCTEWIAMEAPSAALRRLYDEIARIMNTDDMKSFVLGQGSEVALLGPKELTPYLKADIAKWAKVVKAAKIQPE